MVVDLTEVCGETFVEWVTAEDAVLTFSGTFDLGDIFGSSTMISLSRSNPEPGYIVQMTGMD